MGRCFFSLSVSFNCLNLALKQRIKVRRAFFPGGIKGLVLNLLVEDCLRLCTSVQFLTCIFSRPIGERRGRISSDTTRGGFIVPSARRKRRFLQAGNWQPEAFSFSFFFFFFGDAGLCIHSLRQLVRVSGSSWQQQQLPSLSSGIKPTQLSRSSGILKLHHPSISLEQVTKA